jgi:hypothetical protein
MLEYKRGVGMADDERLKTLKQGVKVGKRG